MTTLHVINHTHWDREWFVPFTFTRKWIPQLIKNVKTRVEKNNDYLFLFDGQTLVIEDLEKIDKRMYNEAKKLIASKHLLVGPYYGQIDMRMASGESFIRNLLFGIEKTKSLSGQDSFSAWNVDIFGQISQSPQIHTMFGITSAYIWRGVPELMPFFIWKGHNKSSLFSIDLFAGGYRNFYKVTSLPDLALPRLSHEVQKLQPFYPKGDIPVFDGYDLDDIPGDASSYFETHHKKLLQEEGLTLHTSSPFLFAKKAHKDNPSVPSLSGELISGKYSSVFPGTLSSRTYSKISVDYTERLLYRYAEPLSLFLPTQKYPAALLEKETKMILQNEVHDVLCGCSIDQVHETAELRSQIAARVLSKILSKNLASLSGSLQNGVYAFIPTPGTSHTVIRKSESLYTIEANAVSIQKIANKEKLSKLHKPVTEFSWKNAHYAVTFTKGYIVYSDGRYGQLAVRLEAGDTYWDEPRGNVTNLSVKGPITIDYQTNDFAEISFTAKAQTKRHTIIATVQVVFDTSEHIKYTITTNTKGTGYSLLFRNDYGENFKTVSVGMPYDTVKRNATDTNLFGKHRPKQLAHLLIGQRDLHQTFTFPFQSFVLPATNKSVPVLIAKGLRAYQTEKNRFLDIVLIRSVDYLMAPIKHKYHGGDAGPKFYVPDARCQRQTTFFLSIAIGMPSLDEITFYEKVDAFLNEPLLFSVKDSHGTKKSLSLFSESIPVSSISQYKNKRLARIYNPIDKTYRLSKSFIKTDPFGNLLGYIQKILPKEIATIAIRPQVMQSPKPAAKITLIHSPLFPNKPDSTKPDATVLLQLKQTHDMLKKRAGIVMKQLKKNPTSSNKLWHEYYVVAREAQEAAISYEWNKKRAKRGQRITKLYAMTLDKKLYTLAKKLNTFRMMRRMYDYVVDVNPTLPS